MTGPSVLNKKLMHQLNSLHQRIQESERFQLTLKRQKALQLDLIRNRPLCKPGSNEWFMAKKEVDRLSSNLSKEVMKQRQLQSKAAAIRCAISVMQGHVSGSAVVNYLRANNRSNGYDDYMATQHTSRLFRFGRSRTHNLLLKVAEFAGFANGRLFVINRPAANVNVNIGAAALAAPVQLNTFAFPKSAHDKSVLSSAVAAASEPLPGVTAALLKQFAMNEQVEQYGSTFAQRKFQVMNMVSDSTTAPLNRI